LGGWSSASGASAPAQQCGSQHRDGGGQQPAGGGEGAIRPAAARDDGTEATARIPLKVQASCAKGALSTGHVPSGDGVRPNEPGVDRRRPTLVPMAEMMMRDQSRAGHVLGGTRVADLPDEVSVRDVVRTRIRGEVAAYNADPGPVFRGLVQPADAVRHSDGFRMREPRPLDAELLIAAAEEAMGLGLLRLRLDGRPVDLDELVTLADHGELVAILERSVVASAS
jgi:hypothetical protein